MATTRNAPPSSATQDLISALIGYSPPTESPEQTAAQEFLAELFGVDVATAAERGEDYFTAHPVRRRPVERPYTLPPRAQTVPGIPDDLVWVNMDSSNVDAAAYDEPNQNLYIRFLSGKIYKYWNFPPSRWDDFLASNSKGLFVWHVIRGNQSTGGVYPYEKMN